MKLIVTIILGLLIGSANAFASFNLQQCILVCKPGAVKWCNDHKHQYTCRHSPDKWCNNFCAQKKARIEAKKEPNIKVHKK